MDLGQEGATGAMACDRRVFMGAGVSLLLGGCRSQESMETSTPAIVATVGMVTDIARAIAGPGCAVSGLIGSGIDPHLYRPTRDDAIRVLKARLVFYVGLHLEGRMQQLLERSGVAGEPFAIGEALPKDRLRLAEGSEAPDPHVWMDLSLWILAGDAMLQAIVERMGEWVEGATERWGRLREQLERLDRFAMECFSTIPEPHRWLVTSHDAFGYLGARYGLHVEGIQGLSTDSEAGLRRIRGLVREVVERRLPAVFVETSVSSDGMEAVLQGAASAGHRVQLGGSLFSDAMGPEGTYEGTYVGMWDHNITTITSALGGRVPEGGFRGWSGDGS
ncbi:MAG: metal ABC transporter solute-binding protein, Zn/Mn family [Pirellulaceae bacterium]